MKSHFYVLISMVCILLMPPLATGQSVVRSAIGSSGGEGVLDNARLTWTLGEANAFRQSFQPATGFLTAGFHQPDLTNRLELGEGLLAVIVHNPFADALQSYLYAPIGSILTMHLFDAHGKLVAVKENLSSGAVQWNLESLPNGMYFLGISKRGTAIEYTCKVIKSQ